MRRKPRTSNRLILLLSLFRIGRKHPVLLLTLIALGAGGYAYEVKIARPALLFQGAPKARDAANYETWFRILRNDGFILGYSDLRGNPLWVEYALTSLPENEPSLKRPSRFETDWRSINRVSHDSYHRSGYDRGHMAPNYAISRLYGKQGQADSFLMTNISPQKSKLNQRVWQRLEEIEIQHFARRFGKVWVITGPIFSGTVERLTSDWTVEIPDTFYKIYMARPNPDAPPITLSLVIPQTVKGKEPLMQFVTNVDHIEAQTGLDFFPDLDDKTEDAVEASVNPLPWNLPALSKLPPRY